VRAGRSASVADEHRVAEQAGVWPGVNITRPSSSVRRNGQQMIYAAAYDGMQRLMGFLTDNCCQMDARGCSSDCPQPLSTQKKQKRTRQKIRAA
jgi:hypothetical protein